jgi:hypothetical protein
MRVSGGTYIASHFVQVNNFYKERGCRPSGFCSLKRVSFYSCVFRIYYPIAGITVYLRVIAGISHNVDVRRWDGADAKTPNEKPNI